VLAIMMSSLRFGRRGHLTHQYTEVVFLMSERGEKGEQTSVQLLNFLVLYWKRWMPMEEKRGERRRVYILPARSRAHT
jgi:hypothetical protein